MTPNRAGTPTPSLRKEEPISLPSLLDFRRSSLRLFAAVVFAIAACGKAQARAGPASPAGSLSQAAYEAFAKSFATRAVTTLRVTDGSTGGTRLKGAPLQVCADLTGFGAAVYQLEGEDNGCFALIRFRLDDASDAFLLRVPGAYESNSKLLVVFQGRSIVTHLLVASGMADAGEERVDESIISDFDHDGDLDVLMRERTTHDRSLGLTEPDSDTYALHSWAHDHFEERALSASDPLARLFRQTVSRSPKAAD